MTGEDFMAEFSKRHFLKAPLLASLLVPVVAKAQPALSLIHI